MKYIKFQVAEFGPKIHSMTHILCKSIPILRNSIPILRKSIPILRENKSENNFFNFLTFSDRF